MLRDRLDGVAEVAQQMPPVRDLDSFWRSLPDAISVDAGAVARDDLHPGVPLQPRRKALSPAVGQEVEHPVLLPVDEDGPIAVTAPPCPVIDPKHARGRAWLWRGIATARESMQTRGGWLPVELGFGLTERGWAGAEAGMAGKAGGGAASRGDDRDRGRAHRAW